VTQPRDRVRWAVVGLGNVVSNRFAPALLRSAGSALVACASRDAERARAFASRFGEPRVHATFDDVVADADVDVIYLATPNSQHFPQTRKALEAGKHVLCEKPLALTVEHGRELARLAGERDLRLHVAFQFRFESVFERIRERVMAGAIGEPRAVTLTGASPPVQGATWRADPVEGGILADLGVHLLDLVPWLTGLAFVDFAARAHPADMDREPVRMISILGALESGCHAFVRASREQAQGLQVVSVEGTRGTLACPAWRNAPECVLTHVDATGQHSETLRPAPLFEREIAAFEDALAGRATTLATAADGIHAIAIAEAVRQSVQSGRIVALR
jgi:1,5-anhydro-D-fructose reductase (1,5-anhydro-D-mannitol-forming)